MTTITIKANTKQIDSIYKSISNWLLDFRKPFRELEKIQLKEIDEAFKVEWRNITWKRWEKLKLATSRTKIKLNVNKWILQRSWKMRKSFKRFVLKKDYLVIWNKTDYFKYSQRWTKYAPQRQSLGHWRVMIKRTEILFNKYLLTLIRKWMK